MLDLIDFKMLAIVAFVGLSVESLFPLRAAQKTLRRHWMNDGVYFIVNGVLIRVGVLLIFVVAIGGIRAAVPLGVSAAVQSQPLWLQVIEAFVLADLGFYLAHRAFHAVPWLWRFHAVHHSIEEMDWLAAHRVHPVDQILTKSASLLPLFVFGFADSVIAIWAVTYQWQSLLIHSNTRLGLGPLRWILATPQFHHWHHANEPQAFNKNFAGQLPFLDALFGTLHLPGKSMPESYGTSDPVPPLYHEQLLYPFRRGERPTGAPEQAAVPAGEKP